MCLLFFKIGKTSVILCYTVLKSKTVPHEAGAHENSFSKEKNTKLCVYMMRRCRGNIQTHGKGKSRAEGLRCYSGFEKKALMRGSFEGQTPLWALDSSYTPQRDGRPSL